MDGIQHQRAHGRLQLRWGAKGLVDLFQASPMRALFPGAVTREGDLLVTSQRHRTQEANLDDAMEKLRRMVLEAAAVPAVRELDTDLSDRAKAARTEDKRRRSGVKAARRGSGGDD